MPSNVSLIEVLEKFRRVSDEQTHTAMVAKVESYDPLTNTVNVTPVAKRPLYESDYDEVTDYESNIVLPDVPVCMPRAGGFSLTMPITKGDTVLLVYCEASIAEWRASGEESEPLDVRRHSQGYPVAIPGVFPDIDPLSVVPTDVSDRTSKMVLGKDGGPSTITIDGTSVKVGSPSAAVLIPVALSTPIMTALTAIQLALTKIQAEIVASSANPVDPSKADAIAAISASGLAVVAATTAGTSTVLKSL